MQEAAENGKLATLFSYLPGLEKDGAVNKQDENGITALMLAADRELSPLVEFLLTVKGVDVNIQDSDGQTALHYAALVGNLEVTKLLINGHVDAAVKDGDGTTALELATDEGYAEVASCIAAHSRTPAADGPAAEK